MINTKQAQEITFFVRSSRCIDFGTNPFGQLDCRDTNPAGGAVDKHSFTGLQPSQVMQAVIGRKKCAGDGCCRLKRDSLGDVRDCVGFGNYPVAKAGRTETHDLIPWLECLGLLPTLCTIPANSSPRVGPAKPFSMASSGSRPRVYMISRKLRPVARPPLRFDLRRE